ncbi:MAG TPA: ATP synthase F0 subunit B [Candidatus Saccharimonadales bacterium]|nr:ATP synthase F0 subunit B [Candidatus Saccharimonadales bacterium]
MSDLIHQLGDLLLGAVPVILIVVIFYLVLRSLFFKPILQVMAERQALTIGAQKAAESAQAATAAKVKQYDEALRQAKAKVYLEQEAERKKLLEERAAFLKEARSKSSAEVTQAKERVTGELQSAKNDIEATASQLALEIARRVLQGNSGPGGSTREAR